SVRQDASWWDSMTLAPPAGFRKRHAVSRIGALFRSGTAISLTLFHDNSISCQRMNVSMKHTRTAHEVAAARTIATAPALYESDGWGKGYFTIGDNGQVRVHPTKEPGRSIDLKQLVDHLQLRGIHLPVLIRFRDVLRHRLRDIHEAFQAAIAQHDYSGRYICVYPIKVNQQRQVVEEVLAFGRQYKFGLEAGFKPQPPLLA